MLLPSAEWNAAAAAPHERGPRDAVVIDGARIFPESVTSESDGTLITGSVKGIIFRARPGRGRATEWIRTASPQEGRAIFGVLADERSRTLWACSVPNPFAPPAAHRDPAAHGVPSQLLAFDLASGAPKGAYSFPAPGGVCNDIAVASNGTVYATDTPNGRLLVLAPGAHELIVAGRDDRLRGIDGLAFDSEGRLYVNNVSRGTLLRADLREDGSLGALKELELSRPIAGPDGFRPIGGNRFVLAENMAGRIDEVTIAGDVATIRVLKEGLDSPPGVTLVGSVAYAIEGKIEYLIDPKLKGRDPGTFRITAIPLR